MFHKSERLLLRPAWPEDAAAIFAGIAEQEIVRNLASAPWPYEEQDARRFAEREQDPWLPSFLVTKPGDGIIGGAGLSVDDATGEVQLGYWIARAHWGQGYASEASRAVLEIARALGHETITASHFLDNPASGKVLKKLGFTPTGETRPGFSLARRRHDMVACYKINLAQGNDDTGGDEPERMVMPQAA